MEERTGTEFPTTGTSSTGLGSLEATERSDVGTGYSARPYEVQGPGASLGFGAQKEKARKLGGMARERAVKTADSRKSHIAAEIESFTGTLEDLSRTLQERGNDPQKRIVDAGCRGLRSASKMLRDNSTEQLLDRAQSELRERPALVAAGALALGFLGVRLLKS